MTDLQNVEAEITLLWPEKKMLLQVLLLKYPDWVQGKYKTNHHQQIAHLMIHCSISYKAFPLMSSLPTPQAQSNTPLLSGRATRSLGSVLLEGHLVPQHRLEVAQHVQRMLRGVDMNYQLGEILLMFKLLTPDQLLAASLVSYGLISKAQISALGRIDRNCTPLVWNMILRAC